MNKVKSIQRINEKELQMGVPFEASWHQEYKNSAYIFVGGLNYHMNEGDIVIVFSQFGEVVDCRLARDKETGKSRGFAFLAYEDQRSTVLAVDNLNGIELCGRVITVDHVQKYRIPKEYFEEDEVEDQEEEEGKDKLYRPTGPDGKGWGDFRELNENDLKVLEEYNKLMEKQQKRLQQLDALQELNQIQIEEAAKKRDPAFIVDEDERWEA